MTYQISGSTLFYKNMEEARKAIIQRAIEVPLDVPGMWNLGSVLNEDGIEMGTMAMNTDLLPTNQFLFIEKETKILWPVDEEGRILKTTDYCLYAMPQKSEYFLSNDDNFGFRTIQEAMKAFQKFSRHIPPGGALNVYNKDGDRIGVAIHLTESICAGPDLKGGYHVLNRDGSFGKRVSLKFDGADVKIKLKRARDAARFKDIMGDQQ